MKEKSLVNRVSGAEISEFRAQLSIASRDRFFLDLHVSFAVYIAVPPVRFMTACLASGLGSIVMMTFITDPHFGQLIAGRFLPIGSSLNPGIRRTICKNSMSFLLQG